MDYQKQVESIISKALTEKTFSLEIIDEIKKLKDGFQEAQEEIKELKDEVEEKDKLLTESEESLEKAQALVQEYTERQKAIAEKERKQERLEYELQFQKERATEIRNMFDVVFRNPVVMRSKMTGHMYQQAPGNYPSTMTTNDTEEESIK